MPQPSEDQILRRVIFSPYRRGQGPTFALMTWDTYRQEPKWGKSILGYRLEEVSQSRVGQRKSARKLLFEGEDFAIPTAYGVDSDESVRSIMGFLTLRPGDTDREYFENYTREQLAFADQHAEALSGEVMNRFGES